MRRNGSHFFDRDMMSGIDPGKVVSIDLETLVVNGGFLTGERVIAVSISRGYPDVDTEVLIAEDDSQKEEGRILSELDGILGSIDPDVLIGYNHTGYDIPLLNLKMRGRQYSDQLWNLKYTLGTSYTLDMMYAIAYDLQQVSGEYRIRKLREVVNNSRYAGLPLIRAKELVVSSSMNVGEAIKDLWLHDREKFTKYCQGDTHDILVIFHSMFSRD